MKYTQIPSTAFKNIQMNAGILIAGASGFDPTNGTISGTIIGCTSGGVNFTATPEYADYGEDIDNCPKNTKELKKLKNWEAKMTGTFISVTASLAKKLVGAVDTATSTTTKIVPSNDVESTAFEDLWWVGDYSDVNEDPSSGTGNAGFCAVHLLNGLSTGGIQIKSTDKAKGQFAFEFTGHYSMNAQSTVPFEIYVVEGA